MLVPVCDTTSALRSAVDVVSLVPAPATLRVSASKVLPTTFNVPPVVSATL